MDNDLETKSNQQKSIVNPSKSMVIRRPRNILRVDHLISSRGIAELPKIMSDTKFKGKGNEINDLKLLLFKTKHWAHRLFPGLTFEDFIMKTEHLGHKRIVKNFLNRIRTNQKLYFSDKHQTIQSDNDDDDDDRNSHNDDDQNNDAKDVNQAANNFDILFRDHIEEMKNSENIMTDKPSLSARTGTTADHQDDINDNDDDFIDDNDLEDINIDGANHQYND